MLIVNIKEFESVALTTKLSGVYAQIIYKRLPGWNLYQTVTLLISVVSVDIGLLFSKGNIAFHVLEVLKDGCYLKFVSESFYFWKEENTK